MRDFLPAVYNNNGPTFLNRDENENMVNCVPRLLRNGELAAEPRNELGKDSSFTPNSADDRGRGVTAFSETVGLYLDQTTYYFSGGSQDLTTTSGNGYAGNTGFNEDYQASFVEHLVSGVPNLVIVNAGHTSTHASAKHGNVWYTADGVTAPSSVSDANMPGNNGVSLIRGGASLDGYFFVGDINGQIHNSNLNDITAWTSTDFITAERSPDNGVYLGKHHDNIIYIGTRSIEFFYNAGNASGSPLARRQDVSYQVGCVFPNSVYQEGDVIYFVGNDSAGAVNVYRIVNFVLEKIGDLNIENRFTSQSAATYVKYNIASLDSLSSEMWLTGCYFGTLGIIVTWSYAFSFFYSKPSGTWSRFSFDDTVTYPGQAFANWQNTLPISGFDGQLSSSGPQRIQMINGTIATLETSRNDKMNDLNESNNPDVFIHFARWDGGTNKKKRITSVSVVTEASATDSSGLDPYLVQLRWLDYDRKSLTAEADNFNTGKEIDLNTRSVSVSRLGVTRSRRFQISYTTGHGYNSPVKGLEIEYEIVE